MTRLVQQQNSSRNIGNRGSSCGISCSCSRSKHVQQQQQQSSPSSVVTRLVAFIRGRNEKQEKKRKKKIFSSVLRERLGPRIPFLYFPTKREISSSRPSSRIVLPFPPLPERDRDNAPSHGATPARLTSRITDSDARYGDYWHFSLPPSLLLLLLPLPPHDTLPLHSTYSWSFSLYLYLIPPLPAPLSLPSYKLNAREMLISILVSLL